MEDLVGGGQTWSAAGRTARRSPSTIMYSSSMP
jgi:hypothetical protein